MKLKLQSKKALSALLCAVPMLISAQTIIINETNFPDKNFRACLLEEEFGKDGVITPEEIIETTDIVVVMRNISNLKGIEYFTALTHLDCSYNQLTSLNVSQNTALTYLDCSSNQLTSLDISQNKRLETFRCHSNQLTSLNLSQNTKLTSLNCSLNQLTSLDVSQNTALNGLYCGENLLTSLNVSQNTALTDLNCHSNQIQGKGLDNLIKSLPQDTIGQERKLYIYNSDGKDDNICTKSQVAMAKERGWTPYHFDGMWWNEYEGMDEADGIAQPTIEIIDENAPIYNLAGQKVESLQGKKGIYIVDGKKVFIK